MKNICNPYLSSDAEVRLRAAASDKTDARLREILSGPDMARGGIHLDSRVLDAYSRKELIEAYVEAATGWIEP